MAIDKRKYVAKNAIKVQGDKEYLQVADRVVVFRDEHPDWRVTTESVVIGDQTYMKASVYSPEHMFPMATAHKLVDPSRRGPAGKYPLESAETGAIGRALALCGYGTKMGDLDEGEELADSPVELKKKDW